MLLSTKTTKYTFSFPQIARLFAGNGMINNCGAVMKNGCEVSDYQGINPSLGFRSYKFERVKEIRRFFV